MPTADILQPLVDIANSVLKFFHDDAGLSWGGAIIALTVCTRALLIPLTYKSLKGMRALQALQPQLKEIKEKYKNTKTFDEIRKLINRYRPEVLVTEDITGKDSRRTSRIRWEPSFIQCAT